MFCLSHNRISKNELAMVWLAELGCWRRILYMCDGQFIEVDLTPVNPAHFANWDKVRSINIRAHTYPRSKHDRQYLALVPGTRPTLEMWRDARMFITQELMARLMFHDFLSEMDLESIIPPSSGLPFRQLRRKRESVKPASADSLPLVLPASNAGNKSPASGCAFHPAQTA